MSPDRYKREFRNISRNGRSGYPKLSALANVCILPGVCTTIPQGALQMTVVSGMKG